MKMMPLQLVIIDLENGQRGVFIGRPLIVEDIGENDHQVQNVWFTDIQEMPDSATLEQLTRMTLEQMSQGRTFSRRPAADRHGLRASAARRLLARRGLAYHHVFTLQYLAWLARSGLAHFAGKLLLRFRHFRRPWRSAGKLLLRFRHFRRSE